MKNKLSKIFFYFLIITSFFLKNSYSEEFEFTAKDLEILNDRTLLIGNDDVKIISNNQIIKAKKFRYNKNNLHLELMGNVEIINKLDNTIINADKIDYFKKLTLNESWEYLIKKRPLVHPNQSFFEQLETFEKEK